MGGSAASETMSSLWPAATSVSKLPVVQQYCSSLLSLVAAQTERPSGANASRAKSGLSVAIFSSGLRFGPARCPSLDRCYQQCVQHGQNVDYCSLV